MAIIKPVKIPWPLSSAPGHSPQESAGRLVNCYAEALGATAPEQQSWRRSPGLSVHAETSETGFRGGILVGSVVYAAFSGTVVTIDADGVVTTVGNLTGTKPVTWARNNAGTPDLQVVDPDNGAFTVTSSSVTSFSGGGNLPAPNSICSQDGYLFWGIGDNRIFAAGPNSTTVNALTYTTAQSRATGSLLRVIAYKGQLFAFCSKFTDVFSNTANPFPGFPYSRLMTIDRGLAGRNAIAGWEDGFGKLLWAADDYGVYLLNDSLKEEKVSPPDLDRLIQAAVKADPDSVEASCYVHGGHSVWALTGSTWTWEFNLNTGKWNERDSFNAGLFERWRARGSLGAFGRWLAGDRQSGNVIYIDDTNFQDVDQPLRMRMESGPVVDFPNRTRIARADFDFITGVGISAGATYAHTDPQAMISCSRDGGYTFDTPRLRPLGQAATPRTRVYGLNWGTSGPQGTRWRLDISDPVYAAFLGATQSADPRAN